MVISEANEAESIIAALPQFRQRRARQICLPRGGSAQKSVLPDLALDHGVAPRVVIF